MSNETFLWIFSRGIELGVIVVCLLPLRTLFRRIVPRVFSYLLWSALPIGIVIKVLLRRWRVEADWVHREPKLVVEEKTVCIMKWCWIGGTIIVMLWMIVSYLQFMRRLVGCIRLQKGVYITDRIQTPFTLGLLCPKIYLPVYLDEEYYRYVILHEKVHISRKDVWMKYLAVGVLSLFWFQPILWFACRLFMDDMEEACDETVIRKETLEFREGYAKALVEISFYAENVYGAAVGYGSGEIKSRIKNIMNYKEIGCRSSLLVILISVLFVFFSIIVSSGVPRMVQKKREYSDNGMHLEKTGVTKEVIIQEK